MRAVVQRVSRASVTVEGEVVGSCGRGLLVLVGVGHDDADATARRLAEKLARLRVFENDDGRFDRSLLDVGGEALVVSQFTLLADTRKGTRPSFTGAAAPEQAEPLVAAFAEALRAQGIRRRDGRLRRAHGGRARQRRPGDAHHGSVAVADDGVGVRGLLRASVRYAAAISRLMIHACLPTCRPRVNPYCSNSSTVALNRNRS